MQMKKQLETRLKELKAELQTGQQMLSELQSKEANIKQTLERLSCAIREIEQQLVKEA
jgi:hypothetical protein